MLLLILLTAFAALSLAVAAVVWRDISSMVKGKNRTFISLLLQYLEMKKARWVGRGQRQKLEADTQNVKKVQEEILLKRLHENADTCYGRQYNFSLIKGAADFQARHPLTTYEHYGEFVRRVAAGEENVMTAVKPQSLVMTSGRSGPSAMLLNTIDSTRELHLQGVTVCLVVMQNAFPETNSLQRTAKFFYTPASCWSEAGIPIGPDFSTPTSSHYGHTFNFFSTPAPAFAVPDEEDILYLHLLFALKDPSVGTLESSFASTVLSAFRVLEERWQELVEDIERGKISNALSLQPEVRTRLESLMKPEPQRAARLLAHFQNGFQGIAKCVWPQLRLVLAVDSGSNQIYGEMLRKGYCQGVPFYSPFYAATEGLIGVNLWPDKPTRQYLLCPRSMFFEFLPESSLDEETPQALLMEEVKEGDSYELVVTNASGLFRYRIGDVVKVVGFHNQCPIVEFQYKRGQMLNVRGEEVSEALFLGALKKAVAHWPNAKLVDYSCAESGILGDSTGCFDPHYQVFLELKGVRNLTDVQRSKLDICLQQDSAVYRSFRIKGSIGPMRVQLVSAGAFRDLCNQMMAYTNTSPNTFKMHRVLRRKDYVDFLLRKTVS
uniref:GH3 domain containing n=2 Tax=Iconisemion striatum TaxID=60296 RepID=A0A1A7XYN8_9TELE